MGNSFSTADILRGALRKAGEESDGSSPRHSEALKHLNNVYLAILSGSSEFDVDLSDPWPWARNTTPRSITLLPANETGTVSLTNGLTTGSFSAAPAISMAKRYLKVTDRPTYYQITSHTAGATAFTLSAAYIEATGAALTFKAIPVLYDLGSGILRLVEKFRCYGNLSNTETGEKSEEDGKILGVDLNTLRADFPIHKVVQGVPTRFATQRQSDSEWWVEFNRYPSESMLVDFDFIPMPEGLIESDESIPVIPRQHREMTLENATAWKLWLDKDNTEKATLYLQLTQAGLKALSHSSRRETTHTGKNKGRLFPRQEQLGRPRRIWS